MWTMMLSIPGTFISGVFGACVTLGYREQKFPSPAPTSNGGYSADFSGLLIPGLLSLLLCVLFIVGGIWAFPLWWKKKE